jgi:hypothetical protein
MLNEIDLTLLSLVLFAGSFVAAVSDDSIGADQIAKEILYEVPDDTLENSANIGRAGNYTLYFCTALDLCPGP